MAWLPALVAAAALLLVVGCGDDDDEVLAPDTKPNLVLSTDTLDFGGSETSLPVTITNGGKGTLTWTITHDQAWLSASPANGSTTTEADEIAVTVSRAGLSAGNHSGTVTVAPGTGATQQVAILMTVPGPPPGDFILVQPETFTMGSPTNELGQDSDETRHEVTLTKAFYVAKHEVTQAEWESVMGWNESSFEGPSRPVEQVSWYDAVQYCNERSDRDGYERAYTITNVQYSGNNITSATVSWDPDANGYRLLTEAEWEYACRATNQTAFCNGGITNTSCTPVDPNLDEVGWYCGNAGSGTHDVGDKAANDWGIQDMHGNVWEWCWDWYGPYPGTVTDPVGPASGSLRVLRGGSWDHDAHYCRSASRISGWPVHRSNTLGLRLSRTAP